MTDKVVCQPGAHIKKIARELTYAGIKGYAGLIDLPGTVAAAVVNNSGCYGYDIQGIVDSVDLMFPDSSIRTIKNVDLGFRRRSSVLKRKEIEGVILSVTLKKELGNRQELIDYAEKCHVERQANQPGPANNLGSCFMSGTKTLHFRILERLVYEIGRVFQLDSHKQFELLLRVLGKKELTPYLYNINRFMWTDRNAHKMFLKYVDFYRKIYKNAELEIQIFR